ncbi:AIR synthase family protein [Candidatus Bathyarchaeota archaeon]|nr:AIR synthase family protein [Candidatus Bathyarchaeota archaeon]
MRLPPGKIPVDILKRVVFENLGVENQGVVLGPTAGIDGAIIDLGNKSMIVSMDPITGAVERSGWLAVNINANDVATFGVEPAFFFSCLMLAKDSTRKTVETICNQMNEAATHLGIAIAGGHCEVTPGLTKHIIVGCAVGIAKKGEYVTAQGGKPGDKLILTKSAGIEGTAILAAEKEHQLRRKMNDKELQNAKNLYRQISIVEEALTAYRTGGVHAMHDPTEGGIFGGIHEMADASNLGVRVHEREIPIRQETLKICSFFEIDPLQLISSGALLIAAEEKYTLEIIEELNRKHIEATIIGEFLKDNHRFIVRRNKLEEELVRPLSDHLWRALAKN